MLSKNVQIYVKTTETCNLNCSHCFTSGSSGAKIFFKPKETAEFIKKLVSKYSLESLHLVLHGGEPMLAPVENLYTFYSLTQSLPIPVSYGLQTNLVYSLTESRLNFLNEVFQFSGIGTSWDHNIRFGSNSNYEEEATSNQLKLWEHNVRKLVKEGHSITLMVCLNQDILNKYEPKQIIEYASELGIEYILFERITGNGNALKNPNIFPRNKDLDAWFLKMYEQTIKHKLYLKIKNMFLNEIATSFLKKEHIGNKCRNCEQSLITINADGTVSGCPNSATQVKWGHISNPLDSLIKSTCRMAAVCAELTRNTVCSTCPVNDICNGDCYKLPWEEDICAAPKSLMMFLKNNNEYLNLEKLLFS